MGRRKQMPGTSRTKEYSIWWETKEGWPFTATIDAVTEQDALTQAKEAAHRSGGKKHGVIKATRRQISSMMVRACPSAAVF